MKKLKEVLRLKFESALSHRQIARCLSISPGTISHYVQAMSLASLSWEVVKTLDEAALEAKLSPFVRKVRQTATTTQKVLPDFEYLHNELKRKGVTLQLLHEEYLATQGKKTFSYAHVCRAYRKWVKCQQPSMRQTHIAGEKCKIEEQ